MKFIKNIYRKYNFYFLSILLLSVALNSCIFVKVKEKQEEETHVSLIQKPQIEMNEDALRSTKGDMISLIPKNWFFIDLGTDTPRDVFAIAVNPEYTLSLVFSSYPSNEVLDDVFAQQKLIGLANSSFDKKQKKALGSLLKAKQISDISSGAMEFVVYKYRTKTQPLYSSNAVFKSSLNIIYEVSLVPMNLSGYSLPSETDIDKIFNSVLATIKY